MKEAVFCSNMMLGMGFDESFDIHYVKSGDQLADLGTKYIRKHRHRNLKKLVNEFKI